MVRIVFFCALDSRDTEEIVVIRFGNLRVEHVPEVLDAVLAVQSSSDGFNPETSAPLVPRFWRGRIGLDKQEQLALLARPPSTPSRDFDATSTLQPHVSRQ